MASSAVAKSLSYSMPMVEGETRELFDSFSCTWNYLLQHWRSYHSMTLVSMILATVRRWKNKIAKSQTFIISVSQVIVCNYIIVIFWVPDYETTAVCWLSAEIRVSAVHVLLGYFFQLFFEDMFFLFIFSSCCKLQTFAVAVVVITRKE